MPTLIIKTNASHLTDLLIKDIGIIITSTGGFETFTDNVEIKEIQKSSNLRSYIIDDAYGADSSTVILNDGVGDIPQEDAIYFLQSILQDSYIRRAISEDLIILPGTTELGRDSVIDDGVEVHIREDGEWLTL